MRARAKAPPPPQPTSWLDKLFSAIEWVVLKVCDLIELAWAIACFLGLLAIWAFLAFIAAKLAFIVLYAILMW